ncbi:MAG: ShlB/FhaC/HecB family hemolysin secretion/activation protein, partial [Candidatus Methylomirabilales bacterium]
MKTVRQTAGPIQLLAVGLLLCVFSVPAKVAAQAQLPPAAQPGQQELEPERRPGAPDMTPRPPAEIEKPAPSGAPPKEAEGPKVLVTQFRVTGNTVIPSAKLEALVRSEEGKELSLAQLREVAARITDYYADKGFILARAYLPPQDVREGVLEIAVLEGTIGRIEVTGNERYNSATITRALTRVENAKVVNEGLLETAINDLNDYPGLNVRASLKPGESRGTTDVVLTAQERVPVNFGVDVDNYGSRFTGFWRYGVELGYGNIAGLGDKLSFR